MATPTDALPSVSELLHGSVLGAVSAVLESDADPAAPIPIRVRYELPEEEES